MSRNEGNQTSSWKTYIALSNIQCSISVTYVTTSNNVHLPLVIVIANNLFHTYITLKL